METTQTQPIKDDVNLSELSEIIKITNSVPLAIALFMAILFYKKYDGIEHCNCNDYTRKIEDKTLYLEMKLKDIQEQVDEVSKTHLKCDRIDDK